MKKITPYFFFGDWTNRSRDMGPRSLVPFLEKGPSPNILSRILLDLEICVIAQNNRLDTRKKSVYIHIFTFWNLEGQIIREKVFRLYFWPSHWACRGQRSHLIFFAVLHPSVLYSLAFIICLTSDSHSAKKIRKTKKKKYFHDLWPLDKPFPSTYET